MSYAFNKPENEPVKDYLPGSVEKKSLKEKILEFKSKQIEVPLIIGGRDIKTNSSSTINVPHDHKVQLGKFYNASHEHVI